MEFTNLSRYLPVDKQQVLPFSELRRMKQLQMTQDLKLIPDKDNIEYAESLRAKGCVVVPIRRKPPIAAFLDRIDFPRRILFEMTSKCNYLCRMCPQNNLKRPRMDMDGAKYRAVIDEIDHYGVEGLWIYHLGESLLHPQFIENLKHITSKKNLGIIWMSTNGEFFTEEKVKVILDSNIDYINYSAHAVTEKTYETVCPPGKFNIVQHNLEHYFVLKGTNNLPRKPFMHCQMIEQETTKHEVDAFINKHYQRAEIVSINMLEYVNLPNNTYGLRQRERRPLTNCLRVSRNDCFICSNGDVTLCDFAFNGELCLGNINDKSLYEIWNGDSRKKILELNEQGKMNEIEFCRACTDYDI